MKEQEKIKVSIVIPNWNGLQFLKICLSSLEKQTFKGFEIIIIDNGSLDGSKEFISRNYPKIILISLDKNIGFSPAVNLGIKQAKGEYIFLLNNDTKVEANCLEFLVKALKSHHDVGMVAAKMLQFHNPDLIDSAGDYIDAVGHANNLGYGEKDSKKFNKPKYIFLVTGGGSIFKKEVFEKVGLFDEDYFAYMEDVDLSLRAQFAGFKGYFEPRAIIYHIHKATSNRNKAFTEYLQYRNMTMTVLKDFPGKLFFQDFNWLKILLVNLNTIRYLTSKGYIKPALKAEWYILINFLKILRKRKKIQSNIKVDINYILENIQPKKITFFNFFKNGI